MSRPMILIFLLLFVAGCAPKFDPKTFVSSQENEPLYEALAPHLEPSLSDCFGKTPQQARNEINKLWKDELVSTYNTSVDELTTRARAAHLYRQTVMNVMESYKKNINTIASNNSDKCKGFREGLTPWMAQRFQR